MNQCASTIRLCMEQRWNVLLIGPHGVGKTAMVLEECRRQGLTMKYFSAATLDPWTDLVGIPIPEEANNDASSASRKQLQFVRPGDVNSAEFIFFDELNRAHPKVLNAVLEMIQFRTINGVPLPKLRMVWAAINPPNDIYAVTDLDPVLLDRFHVHLNVQAEPSVEYYRDKAGIPEQVAKAIVRWWQLDLNDDLRKLISPRRLEYMGRAYLGGIPLGSVIPFSVKAPLASLVRRLEGRTLLPFELTRETLCDRQKEILSEMAGNVDVMLAVSERLQKWPDVIPRAVPLFLAMTSELQATLVQNTKIRAALVNLGRQGRHGGLELRPLADRLIAMGIPLR